jgi:hypothetical protein
MSRVGHTEEIEGERYVQEHVDEQRHPRPQREHERAADGGADQHGQVAADRVETDRARKVLGAHDVVHDELDGR